MAELLLLELNVGPLMDEYAGVETVLKAMEANKLLLWIDFEALAKVEAAEPDPGFKEALMAFWKKRR